MKIYFDGVCYYTQERFLSMVKSNAAYIVDPSTTFYAEKVGYGTQLDIDGTGYIVFRPEQLVDEDIIYLLSREYGGFITAPLGCDELAKAFGFEDGYNFIKTKEIEVKE